MSAKQRTSVGRSRYVSWHGTLGNPAYGIDGCSAGARPRPRRQRQPRTEPATANGALLIHNTTGSYTIYPDGTRKKLVSKTLIDGQFSPDGQLIAWSGTVGGNTDIYITTSTGTNLRRVTTNPAPDTSPTWSPDGKRLAFTSCRNQGLCDIYVIKSTAPYGQTKQLTHSGYNLGGVDYLSYRGVRWSPKTDHLIVGRILGYDEDPDDHTLIGMTSAGATKPAPKALAFAWDWSADGTSVVTDNAINVDIDGASNLQLCAMPSGTCHNVTPADSEDYANQGTGPVFAPNKQLIAYKRGIGGANIWFIKPDGTQRRSFLNGSYVMDWRSW